MKNSKWNLLKDRQIIDILDGNISFAKLIVNNEVVDAKMKYLSGPMICNLAGQLGDNMLYLDKDGNARSRWMYFEDLIDFCINAGKMNQLLNMLFSKESFRSSIEAIMQLENFEIPEYRKTIPEWKQEALKTINNILYVKDKCLSFKNNMWKIGSVKEFEVPVNDKLIQASFEKNDRGFYILPFQKYEEDMMEVIKDRILIKNINFDLIKSGDIFEGNDEIFTEILSNIQKASVLVADISEKNPNVFYELGIAKAWDKKVIMICSEESKSKYYESGYPFDIAGRMILTYSDDYSGMKDTADKVIDRIVKIRESN